MQTTRREFLKAMGVVALAATVPLEWGQVVVEWGHEWRTGDEGQTWAWDNHWFNAQGDCSWA